MGPYVRQGHSDRPGAEPKVQGTAAGFPRSPGKREGQPSYFLPKVPSFSPCDKPSTSSFLLLQGQASHAHSSFSPIPPLALGWHRPRARSLPAPPTSATQARPLPAPGLPGITGPAGHCNGWGSFLPVQGEFPSWSRPRLPSDLTAALMVWGARGAEGPLPEVEAGAGPSQSCLGGPGPCPDAIFQVPGESSVSLWGW